MPDDTVAASGAQFARDLRRIRVEQDLSIPDVHEKTRISVDLIESFEAHGLFKHPSFNQVYLRSFVRSYASCVGVEAPEVLDALEAALNGQYTNQLAVTYLDASPQPPPAPEAEDEASVAPKEEMPKAAPLPTEAQAPAPGDPVTPGGNAQEPPAFLPEESKRGVLIVLAIVVGLAALWGVVFLSELSPDTDTQDPQDAASPADTAAASSALDTAEQAAEPIAQSAAASPVALGDTLYVTLIAERSPIEGVRIKRDEDLRRPYWVEQGEAAVFPAQQEISIGSFPDDVALLLNGYPWTRPIQGEITITRADARSFLDSVAAAPVDLDVPADTNYIPGTQRPSSSAPQ